MNNLILKIIRHRRIFLFIWVFAIILLLILAVLHLKSGMLGTETSEQYHHIRIASEIADTKKIPSTDYATVENREYIINPYHILLAVFIFLLGKDLSILILPLILGILMLLIFILTLNQMGIDKERVVLIVFLTIISPTFLNIFSTLNDSSLALVLMFLAFYLLITFRQWILQFVSILLFVICLFFNLFGAVIAIIFLTLGYSIEKAKAGVSRLWILMLIVVTFVYYSHVPLSRLFIYSTEPYLGVLLSDLGSFIGFSTFFLVLSLVGMMTFWKRKSELWLIYFIALFIFIGFFLFKNIAIPYALLFLGIFAGFGFYRIIASQWKLKLLGNLTLVLILCGLFFSTLSYLNHVKNSEFNPTLLQSLEWLNKNDRQGAVLSYQGYGFAIEYIANMPVVADYLSSEKYVNLSNYLLSQRNIERFGESSNEYGIRYVLITPEMRNGLVWSRKDDGLLFLLKNSENFNKVFDKNDCEVWEVEQK
jgi:hypothetical protein